MPLSEVLWEENWVYNRNCMHLYMWTKQSTIGERCYAITGIVSAWSISGYVHHFVSLPVWTITDNCLELQFKTGRQPYFSSGSLCGVIWSVPRPWLPVFSQVSWHSAVRLPVNFRFRELYNPWNRTILQVVVTKKLSVLHSLTQVQSDWY
jgi:hypothetical protein